MKPARVIPLQDRINDVVPNLEVIASNLRKFAAGTLNVPCLTREQQAEEMARQIENQVETLRIGW